MKVKVYFNNKEYELKYNEQTDFYEIDLIAPLTGGVYNITAEAIDLAEDIIEETKQIQVLAKIKQEKVSEETVVYFLDKKDLEIKDVIEYGSYEFNIDEETNATTTFNISRKNDVKNGDIVVLKRKNEIEYLGIVQNAQNENGEAKQEIVLKYITNIFDKKVILAKENLISEKGIEDFIYQTIIDNFTNSEDTLLNINWLEVEVLTHTKLKKSVDNENGIYNFHTFITNCTQHYNIVYNFIFTDGKIKLKIYKQNQENILIDSRIEDISNYTEVFETDVLAKVTIKTSTSIKQWFLKSDRTITDNINDLDRATGKEDIIYTENDDDAYQSALDAFKGNSYNHYISFSLNKESQLFDVSKIKVGTPLSVRTDNNVILDTYVSAITDNGSKFINITCGNMRIDFIDKISQERRKND